MNRNYNKGRRFEYLVAHHFKTLGCVCTRSAGSHGLWDLVAVALGPLISMNVRMWLNSQHSKAERGFLNNSLEWPTTQGQKRLYYRMVEDVTDHSLILFVQCKSKG